MARRKNQETEEEIILDFTAKEEDEAERIREYAEKWGIDPEEVGPEEALRRNSVIAKNKRYYDRRVKNFTEKKGWPVEIAEFMARIGVPVRAQTDRDSRAHTKLAELLENWEYALKDFTRKGMSRREAEDELLRELAEDNEARGRSKYNVFTFGS